MREATSGSDLPHATYTWPIANQAIAAGAAFTPAAIPISCAVANAMIMATARATLPVTAAGSAPNIQVFASAPNAATLTISNQSAAALIATAADIVIDLMVLPIVP
jgi:hypothetical protein